MQSTEASNYGLLDKPLSCELNTISPETSLVQIQLALQIFTLAVLA